MHGLPPSFDLDVKSPSAGRVDWGDYLEEEQTSVNVVRMPSRERPKPPARRQPSPPAEPVREQPQQPAELASRESTEPTTAEPENRVVRTQTRERSTKALPTGRVRAGQPAPPRPKRKQVNMNPETLTVFEDLVDYVRERCGQRDIFASDIMDALVLAASNARKQLDLGALQPRGRWGTESAAAFRATLREAVERAIVKRLSKAESSAVAESESLKS